MKKLLTIIVEDNLQHRALLEDNLAKECPYVTILGYAESAEEGYAIIKKLKPELVFLDIELHRSTGFDMLRMLQAENAINFEIIFVTGFGSNENQTLALDYSALSFIKKPPTPYDLREAVQNAVRLIETRTQLEEALMLKRQIEVLMSHILNPQPQADPEIVLDLTRGIKEVIKVYDILYLEADSPLTQVNLKGGRRLTAMKHLGHYSKMLMTEFDFFQIHHSIVVNLREVSGYETSGQNKKVVLYSGAKLECARRRFDAVKKAREFLGNKGGGDDGFLTRLINTLRK